MNTTARAGFGESTDTVTNPMCDADRSRSAAISVGSMPPSAPAGAGTGGAASGSAINIAANNIGSAFDSVIPNSDQIAATSAPMS
jgi:hypothetical protein